MGMPPSLAPCFASSNAALKPSSLTDMMIASENIRLFLIVFGRPFHVLPELAQRE